MNFAMRPNTIPIVIIRRSGRPAVIFSCYFRMLQTPEMVQRGADSPAFGGVVSVSVYLTHYLRPQGRDFSVYRAPFSRTAVKSKLGVTDCKSAKDTASIWHRIPPLLRSEFLDYGDVAMPRTVNYRRFPRSDHPS